MEEEKEIIDIDIDIEFKKLLTPKTNSNNYKLYKWLYNLGFIIPSLWIINIYIIKNNEDTTKYKYYYKYSKIFLNLYIFLFIGWILLFQFLCRYVPYFKDWPITKYRFPILFN